MRPPRHVDHRRDSSTSRNRLTAAGIAAALPELRVDHEHKVIYRGDSPVPGKVGLISGGGSGHEPLHGGFVGVGIAVLVLLVAWLRRRYSSRNESLPYAGLA